MKKFLVVCTALTLLCLSAPAQEFAPAPEAEDSGRSVGLSVIPRFEFNYNGDFTLGDSSLYSLFEGNISDALSFSICNHWLAGDKESISLLYSNTGRSDDINWLDWAYLNYALGNFSFTLGKQSLTFGGYEFDAYDFESFSFLSSSAWYNLQVYLWGLKADWTNPSENTTLSLQMTSSPFGEHPFTSGLFNYAAEWRGEYGNFANIWSVAALQRDKGDFIPLISLGQTFSLTDEISLGLDIFNIVGDEENVVMKGLTMIPSITYTPSDRLMLRGRMGGEINRETKNKNLIVGIDGYWLPLKECEDLRLMASAGYNHDLKMTNASLGILYYLNFPRK